MAIAHSFSVLLSTIDQLKSELDAAALQAKKGGETRQSCWAAQIEASHLNRSIGFQEYHYWIGSAVSVQRSRIAASLRAWCDPQPAAD